MSVPLLVLARDARLESFGDLLANVPVANMPLHAWQERAARLAGLELRRVTSLEGATAPYFWMDETLFATPEWLRDFANAAQQRRTNAVAAIPSHPARDPVVQTHKAHAVPGGFSYALHYVHDAVTSSETPLLVPVDDPARHALRLPKAIHPAGVAFLFQGVRGVLHIHAPVHLYQANMFANVALMAARMPRFGFQRRAHAVDPVQLNQVGSGCNIHRTAVVENCVLGDGVNVGAFAVLQNSMVGAGTQVCDGAVVQGSVVGPNVLLGHQYRVIQSVMLEDSFATSGALQFSLVGRRAAVFAAWVTDVRMDGKTVHTLVDGRIQDSGMLYLGIMLGHGAKLTAGVISGAGRVVPNGLQVYPDPSVVLSRIPPNMENGTLTLGRAAGVPSR